MSQIASHAVLLAPTALTGAYSTSRAHIGPDCLNKFASRTFGNFIKFSQALQSRLQVGPTIVGLLDIDCAFILHETYRNSSL